MSLRLSEGLAAELSAVARADGVHISKAVREAIEKHIADRKRDPDFQKRLKKTLEEDLQVLERLVDDATVSAKDGSPIAAAPKDDIPF